MRHAPLVVLLAVPAALAGCVGSDAPSRPPDYELADSEGTTFRFHDLLGQPVVMFFMKATNCPPCYLETRDQLVPAYEELNGTAHFLSLDIDPFETDRDLNDLKRELGADWPHARDTAGVHRDYGVRQLSVLVILDDEGRVVFKGLDPPKSRIVSEVRSAG